MATYTLDGSHSADSNILIPDPLVGKLNNILRSDSTDNPLNLTGAHPSAGRDNLATDILSNGSGAIQAQKKASLELGLRTLNLSLGDGLGHAAPLAESEMDQIIEVSQVLRDHVAAPETSVRVAGAEAHEGVAELVLVESGRELAAKVRGIAHSAIPVANDGLGNQGSEVVRILPADTLDGDGDVCGGDSIIAEADLGTDELGSGSTGRTDGERVLGRLDLGEVLLGQFDELLVGDTASTNKDHTVGAIVGGNVVLKVLLLDGKDVLLRAEDGAAEGLVLEGGSVKVVKDDLLELLIDLFLLTEDHIPLTLDGGLIELGVLEDIRKDLDGLADILLERLGIVHGAFALE